MPQPFGAKRTSGTYRISRRAKPFSVWVEPNFADLDGFHSFIRRRSHRHSNPCLSTHARYMPKDQNGDASPAKAVRGAQKPADEAGDGYRLSTSFMDVLHYVYVGIAPRHYGKNRWHATKTGLCGANGFARLALTGGWLRVWW